MPSARGTTRAREVSIWAMSRYRIIGKWCRSKREIEREFEKMIKAVLFDMGNTLVDSRTTEGTFSRILREKGHDVPHDIIKNALDNVQNEPAPDVEVGDRVGISSEDFYIQYNNDVIEYLDLKNPEPDLGKFIYDRWFEVLHIYLLPNVERTVNELKARGIKTGIITNGFRDEVNRVFTGLPIQPDDFDLVIGCNTTGFAKPNPRPFKLALEMLGLQPEEVMFVGDSYRNDYQGSGKVGMRPVLYLPKGKPSEKGVVFVRDLKDLLDML